MFNLVVEQNMLELKHIYGRQKEGKGILLAGFAECLAFCGEYILSKPEFKDLYESVVMKVCIFNEMWGFAYYDEKHDNMKQVL